MKNALSVALVLGASLFGWVPDSYAGVNKCIGKDGRLDYREAPCAEGVIQKSINISNPSLSGDAGGGKWFTLLPQEEYISGFNLQPGGTKEVSIRSNASKHVMFRTNVSKEMLEKYRGNYPIEMQQVGAKRSVVSFYAGGEYSPVAGEIRLRLKNGGKDNFDILVVTIKQ